MKKIITIAIATLLILVSIFAFSSCNTSQPVEIQEVVGTYKMTAKTSRHKSSNETKDYLVDDEIVSYLVVPSNNYGYYIYQDKDTELYCKEVKIKFYYENDAEDENNSSDLTNSQEVKYIEYEDGQNEDSGRLYVQGSSNTLTNNVVPIDLGFIANNYYRYTEYTKISSDQTLATVNAALETTLSYVSYDKYICHGLYYRYYSYGYVYYYMEINMITNTATEYYMLEEDEVQVKHSYSILNWQKVEENGTITFVIDGTTYTFYDFSTAEMQCMKETELGDGTTYDQLVRWIFMGEGSAEEIIEGMLTPDDAVEDPQN